LCQELALFTTAPALAIPRAIVAASIDGKQIHLCEINQAFAVSFFVVEGG
jgi:acetyl-CoA acetyltransferase